MSTVIDNRVVEMQFDNAQFERNVSTSMSTLDKLKQSLNLTGASKGLESVGNAAKGIDMSHLGSSVETVGVKFNALWTIADQTLRNITNSAYNAGTRLVKALTIDPIKTGFQEYETQINAVQTILANTSSKGTTMDDVNKALDTLNTYADKTIYNFTEMTRNIGTFTAAGVDLDTSVSAIQGIANLAAVSGSSSQQASTAMYQLSQALANGKVNLQDWNSVVNAGMGGQVFQDALKRTATVMGTDVDAMIKKYGSFRESLTKGEWLTTDVLTKTLEQFTMSAKEGSKEWENYKKSLMDEGYTAKQAEEILKMANTATDAATKVKTFTQLWDTLKEAAQSGWTQTWEIIVGDFEEAKEMLTNISDVVGDFINKTSQARNALLQGWKDAGGRADLIKALGNAFKFLTEVMKPIKAAFKEIFPKVEVKHLTDFTTGLKNFTANLKLSSETSEKLKSVFKGVFSIFEIGRKVLVSFGKAIGKLFMSDGVGKLGTFLLDIAAAIGDFFTSINEGFDSDGLTGVLTSIVNGISDLLGTGITHINSFTDLLSAAGDVIANVFGKIWGVVKKVGGWISETFSAGDIFAGLAGGGIFVLAQKLSGFIDNIVDPIKDFFDKKKGAGIFSQFKDILEGVGDSLNAFATSIKVSSLVSIAIAIGVLSASLKTISGLDTKNIVKSLSAMGIMFGMLSWSMASITKTLEKNGSGGIVKAGFSLVLVAGAINILAKAMEKMSKLSFKDICKGLIGIGGGLVELSVGLKIIGKTKIPLSTSVAMLALAGSCSILGDALKKFGDMSWDEIKKGLSGMGGALTEFVVAIGVLQKFGGFKSMLGSAAILIAVQSLDKMAEGLKKFGNMSWDQIKKGLTAMGSALAELSIAIGGVGKFAGFSSLFASGSIAVVIQGLDDLAEALKKFGTMTWDEIKKGLTSMGIALGEVAGVTGALGKIAGFSGVFGSGAILIAIQGLDDLANALYKFGQMQWDEIGRGLAAMGGALLEVGGISGGLGYLAGIAGIIGAGTIWIAVQGLEDLATSFQKFGSMSWDEIGRGLVAMGGALFEIGGISGAMGYLTGIAGLVGAGTIALATQGLDDLAVAFQKFGSMSWEEIKIGLAAMGGALGETALGGLLNTFSGIGALAISEMASSLGVLADSVKKWEGVTVPEGLGGQLGSLARGVEKFTFAGIGASAIAEAAPAVGIMADSVKKWSGVTIPEGLTGRLEKLSEGVKKFTWAGLGASALADAAPAVGQLADGVKKWKDVTVPKNIGEDMKKLAGGVKSFSFAFMGGWSLSALVKPLGELPGSISKWSGVTVPEGLQSGLKSLANGVKSFSFAFAGGWSMSAIVAPLGDLAGSIKKWVGISIPEGFGGNLKSVANGIKSFASIGDISSVGGSIDSLASGIKNLSGVGFASISSGLDKLTDSIKNLGSTNAADAGVKLMTGIANGITKGRPIVTARYTQAITAMFEKTSSYQAKFQNVGIQLMIRFGSGITSQRSKISNAVVSTLNSAVSKIRSIYTSFYTAGSYVVSGFASGITANTFRAQAAAVAMAKAALKAAKAALGINSPSKEFYSAGGFSGMGFVNALRDYGTIAANAGYNLGESAKDGLNRAIAKISNVINSDIDAHPTIRPVLDLSDIRSGAGSINDMLSIGSSVGVSANVNAISSMMARRGQNSVNDEVVSAINKLRKELGNVGNTSYNINGVTYDNGSEVADAVRTIARHIKLEGRT